MEKQIVQFNFPGMTERQYDQVWDELRKVDQSNPRGLQYHVSSFKDNSCLVVAVWESREAFDRFSQILLPILNRLGFPQAQLGIAPVYYEYSGVESHASH